MQAANSALISSSVRPAFSASSSVRSNSAINGSSAPKLKLHLRFARNQGWTGDELAGALLHLAGYAGAPLVREAMLTACETFAELRAES